MVKNTKKTTFEPPWPKPTPYTSNIFRRLARGWKSWLSLLNEWDFRISLGELNLFGLPVFLVNQPTLVRKILVEEVEEFPKHAYTLWILEPLIGRAIFSVNGEEWEIQRRLIDQVFQIANLKRVFPSMVEATQALLHRLESKKNDDYIDIDEEMTLVTADVIVRTILSRPLEQNEASEIFQAFSRYQKRAGRALVLRFLRLPKGLIQRSLKRDAAIIRDWIQCSIHERLNQHKLNRPNSSNPKDLLDMLILAKDPKTNKVFSEEDLVDQVCFLFLAGHETSASSLGLSAWLLALDPKVQERTRNEVLLAVGERSASEMLESEEIRQLPYVEAVFNETLRLYPPVSFFIREKTQNHTELQTSEGAKKCPVGALLTLSPWVIHRHEKHWREPHHFQPERFIGSDEVCWRRDAFLPFGMGPRKCPGASFAKQEAVLVLAEILRRYELIPNSEHQLDFVGLLTLRSRNGIRLKIKPLEHNAKSSSKTSI